MSNPLSRKRAALAAEQLARDIAQPVAAHVDALQGLLQMAGTANVVGFLRSGIDGRMLLGNVLADRGLNQDGVWVGFAEAERLFVAAFPGAIDAGLIV